MNSLRKRSDFATTSIWKSRLREERIYPSDVVWDSVHYDVISHIKQKTIDVVFSDASVRMHIRVFILDCVEGLNNE